MEKQAENRAGLPAKAGSTRGLSRPRRGFSRGVCFDRRARDLDRPGAPFVLATATEFEDEQSAKSESFNKLAYAFW
jgi:hypothetical protein